MFPLYFFLFFSPKSMGNVPTLLFAFFLTQINGKCSHSTFCFFLTQINGKCSHSGFCFFFSHKSMGNIPTQLFAFFSHKSMPHWLPIWTTSLGQGHVGWFHLHTDCHPYLLSICHLIWIISYDREPLVAFLWTYRQFLDHDERFKSVRFYPGLEICNMR